MQWVTWDQAIIAALVSAIIALVLSKAPSSPKRDFLFALSKEFALIAVLYTLWRLAMVLPLDQPDGAIERARDINRWQQNIAMPTELSLQQFVMRYDWLARSTNFFYAVVHVPATVAFLVWLFVRQRGAYPRWRNALAMLTAACLVIRYVRVAPPRFLPELGYVDLATRYGLSVYGPVGTGVSDQFAAMPSIHVGWAALVTFGVIGASTSRWRWLFLLHFVFTMFAVTATGNHWWLDGIAAVALLGVTLSFDTHVLQKYRRRKSNLTLDQLESIQPGIQ
jgi:hypothetical protein